MASSPGRRFGGCAGARAAEAASRTRPAASGPGRVRGTGSLLVGRLAEGALGAEEQPAGQGDDVHADEQQQAGPPVPGELLEPGEEEGEGEGAEVAGHVHEAED